MIENLTENIWFGYIYHCHKWSWYAVGRSDNDRLEKKFIALWHSIAKPRQNAHELHFFYFFHFDSNTFKCVWKTKKDEQKINRNMQNRINTLDISLFHMVKFACSHNNIKTKSVMDRNNRNRILEQIIKRINRNARIATFSYGKNSKMDDRTNIKKRKKYIIKINNIRMLAIVKPVLRSTTPRKKRRSATL